MNYWEECISEAFDDAGIEATKEQIEKVASWVEGSHENYGMATGCDCIQSPYISEIEELKKQLEKERNRILCRECKGSGLIISQGPYHSAESRCMSCNGSGFIY